MIINPASESLETLETRRDGLRGQWAARKARARVLETGIADVQAILDEAEVRLREQQGVVFRARQAAGRGYHFGGGPVRTTMLTRGGKTERLTGPAPLDSPKGQADHAHRVHNAIEAEVRQLRSALLGLQNELRPIARDVGLIGLEIETVEGRIAGKRAEAEERAQLLGGSVTFLSRMAAILRRLMQGTQPPSIEELRAQNKSVREIADLTGISKSEVARRLSTGVPGGTADRLQGT